MNNNNIVKIIGSKVRISIKGNAQANFYYEKGLVTNIVVTNTDIFFIELDNNNFISSRFIMQIEIID